MAKKIGIALLVLVILVGVTLGVLWRRLTALPDWYENPDMVAEDGAPQIDRDWVRIPVGEPHAGGYLLRNPHLRAVKESGESGEAPEAPPQSKSKPKSKSKPIQKAIKQSRAVYEQGELEAGAVINLSDMDVDSLSPAERERYRETIEAFPALTGRDVYVGIEGGVDRGDGALALGRDTKLRVGDTRYSLKTAAKRLGMSEAQLRAEIENQLARMDVPLPPPAE